MAPGNAKIKQELITTTSRSRTRRWGRPHHVECLNQNTSPKTTALTAQALNSFPHRKAKRSELFMQHALCCVSFLLALPSWQWQRKTKMNSHPFHPTAVQTQSGQFIVVEFTGIPKTFQNHLKLLTTHHKFQNRSSRPQAC